MAMSTGRVGCFSLLALFMYALVRPSHGGSRLCYRWSLIAARLPGRTDNEIKNYWNTHIKRKLLSRGIDPQTHRSLNPSSTATITNNELNMNGGDVTTITTTANSIAIAPTTQTHTGGFQLINMQGSLLQFAPTSEAKNPNVTRKATNYAPIVGVSGQDEDSNNSVVTGDDQLEGVNLDLSISLPSPPARVSSSNVKQEQDQQQQYPYLWRGSTNTPIRQLPTVPKEVCLCCHLGFQNSKSCNCLSMTTTITYGSYGQ